VTWTYSGDPAASARDAVRFLIRDTDHDNQQISDEEVAWLLSENGNNVYLAGASAATTVSAKLSNQVRTKTVGALSITYAARAQEYRTLASDLEAAANKKTAIAVYSGGISRADKDLQEEDTDWDQPAFRREMHDFFKSRPQADELGYVQ
jgi:hypothetical protein